MKKLFAVIVTWAIFSTQVFAESALRADTDKTVSAESDRYLAYIQEVASEMSEEEAKEWHAYLASIEDAALELTEEEKQEYAKLAENFVSKYSEMSEEEKQDFLKAAEKMMAQFSELTEEEKVAITHEIPPKHKWLLLGVGVPTVLAILGLAVLGVIFLAWAMSGPIISFAIGGLALMLGYGVLTATGEEAQALKLNHNEEMQNRLEGSDEENLVPMPLH